MISWKARLATCAALAVALGAPAGAWATTSTNLCIEETGSSGWCGDGQAATRAKLSLPRDVAPLPGGGYLVADSQSHVIRRVSADGRITTIAGTGEGGYPKYGQRASRNPLGTPAGVAALPDGGYLIADMRLGMVLRVTPGGKLKAAAGQDPRDATSGDGGPATRALLQSPRDVIVLPDGGYAIADAGDDRVRRVLPDGTITTLAGTGVAGATGDGGPATAARLNQPTALSLAADGSILVADRGSARIRRIAPDGTITTVAGGGSGATPALAATLSFPTGVSATADGGFLVAEAATIRRVDPDGSITSVAGTGVAGFNTLMTPALAVALAYPAAIATLPDGGALVADTLNDRVRRIDPAFATMTTVAGRGVPGPPGTPEPAPAAMLPPPPAPNAATPIVTDEPLPPAGSLPQGAAEPAFVNEPRNYCASPEDPDPVGFSDLYILPHGKKKLKVARRVSFKLQISNAATVVAKLTRSGRTVRTLTQKVGPSAGRKLTFKKSTKPGTYRLRLQATSRHGRRCAGLKLEDKR
jgi:hypothetical protein